MKQVALLIAAGLLLSCHRTAPGIPERPFGPGWTTVGSPCSYEVRAETPDGAMVAYRIDWGDGDTSEWTPYVPSGTGVALAKAWSSDGVYDIRAQARSASETDWSEELSANVLPVRGYPLREAGVLTLDGRHIAGMSASPAGPQLYVSLCGGSRVDDKLVVIDTDSNRVAAIVPLAWIGQVAVSPDGDHVYVLSRERLLQLRAADCMVSDSLDLPDSLHVRDIEVTGDGAYIYVALGNDDVTDRLLKIETAGLEVVAEIDGLGDVVDMVGAPRGEFMYVIDGLGSRALSLRVSDNVVTGRVLLGVDPVGAAIAPDGSRLYVGNGTSASVLCIETSGFHEAGGTTVGDWLEALAVHASGRYLYLATYEYEADAYRLNVVDSARWTVIASVTLTDDPHIVLSASDGRTVYASLMYEPVIHVYGF